MLSPQGSALFCPHTTLLPHTWDAHSDTHTQTLALQVEFRDADLNSAAPSDFYQLLSLDYDADGTAIRSSYRALQRIAHPDIAGESPPWLTRRQY